MISPIEISLAGILVLGAALAFRSRTRAMGLVLLGLLLLLGFFACGYFFVRSDVHRTTSSSDLYHQRLQLEQALDEQQAIASEQAKIVELQQWAATMSEPSADEGYGHEHFVRQETDGRFEIVTARRPSFLFAFGKIMIILLMVAFAGGLAFRALRRRDDQRGSAIPWAAVAIFAPVALVLIAWIGARQQGRTWHPPLVEVPLPTSPIPPQPAEPQESLEAIWARMTAPKINLNDLAASAAFGANSPQEVTDAAKVILAASIPGADPFTQGWLVNAAKAIVNVGANVRVNEANVERPKETVFVADAATTAITLDESITSASSPPPPEWVTNPPKLVGSVRKIVVSAGPYATVEECHRELKTKMGNAVQERAIELARTAHGANLGVPLLESMGLGTDYILRELCTDDYIETSDTSIGEMKTAYALLEFNEAQDASLVERAVRNARRHSVEVALFLAASTWGGVALIFGLFKADTWTRGYYTKRLFLGVPAAIIGLIMLLS